MLKQYFSLLDKLDENKSDWYFWTIRRFWRPPQKYQKIRQKIGEKHVKNVLWATSPN